MKKKAIIVSGYFNPIHKGHLEYFNNAKSMADELFVIVNSDFQRELKEPVVFDGRNQYNAFKLQESGFEYYQIGKN